MSTLLIFAVELLNNITNPSIDEVVEVFYHNFAYDIRISCLDHWNGALKHSAFILK